MTVRERDIERALVGMVKRHGGLALKWVCPGWAGVPDRIILLPGGKVFFVETKRPHGGEISRMQAWWAAKLQTLGFQHFFIRSRSDLYSLSAKIERGREKT